jgi:magnesium transporter
MSADTLSRADAALSQRFLLDFPYEAARLLEALPADEAASTLAIQPAHAALPAWERLSADVALDLLARLPSALACHLLAEAEPIVSVAVLRQLDGPERDAWLQQLGPEVGSELRGLLDYPADSAGSMMDPRISPLHTGMSVAQAINRLRQIRRTGLRELFVIDDAGRLCGRVEMQDLALAEPALPLADITRGVLAVAQDLDPREDVVETLQQHPITALPVVNISGRLIGVILQEELLAAVEEETSMDMLTMVGASPDERALSSPVFAVRKRLPWLQINLVTAFLAASVVGLFEGVISQFTALAVLLPVVAGQSGNAGAQALAVTMRGLVLREISLRHWFKVLGKEALTGLINGVAVALTTGVGVYVWSHSWALAAVIMSAMVISMLAAGLAGALVPMLLRRFGQDPATASSIILTTVTDVVGFFSFLGIATLFAPLLAGRVG